MSVAGFRDANGNGTMEPYENPALDAESRAADLAGRMTAEEKCAQLGMARGFDLYRREGTDIVLKPGLAAELAAHPVGKVYALARADWWTGKDLATGIPAARVAETVAKIQRLALAASRHGIPIWFEEEAPHGLMALEAPVFPTGLALGATFDRGLMEAIGERNAREARARGLTAVYAPILDLAVDPRWSRCEECFGESPALVARLGAAETRGLVKGGVVPCLKHFVGGGLCEGGRNTYTAHCGPFELFNRHILPFRYAIREGAGEVMCTYHDVDGEPCTGSRWLLDEVLRGELGFTGFVTADSGAIAMGAWRRWARSPDEAAAISLKAGADSDYPRSPLAACGECYLKAFRAGLLAEADLDRAVRRVLAAKFRCGLFERPFPEPEARLPSRESGRALALEAAEKSLVLLANRGDTLPLDDAKLRRVAVIGPNAGDRIMNQLGDYTAPQRREDVVTVLDALARRGEGRFEVVSSLGCRVRNPSRDGFGAAVAAAAKADVTVLVLGGSSSPYGKITQNDEMAGATVVTGEEDPDNDKDSGEGTDRRSLTLSGVQTELFRAVRSVSRKLVVVLVTGRAVEVGELLEKADSVLLAWYPGGMGGEAVARALFGETNPGGRLPVTFPRDTRTLPCGSDSQLFAALPRYIDGEAAAELPFGYGLSYTAFAYSGLAVERGEGELPRAVSVTVTNVGARKGDEIVRFYFTINGGARQRPWRELMDFARVTLAPGESRRVSVPFDAELVGGWDRTGKAMAPYGRVTFSVPGCEGFVDVEMEKGMFSRISCD